jgi:Mrp family chromosome partitioning ATPase
MSTALAPTNISPDGLHPPSYLSVVEAIQLTHLLRPEGGLGTVVQMIAARDGEGTSSLARDLSLIAARETGLRVLLLDIDGIGRKQADWVRQAHQVPLNLIGTIAARPADLAILRVGISSFHVGEPQQDIPVPGAAWLGILKLLRPRFDLVVVDSPALARSFDGILFAPHADGSILVIEAEVTRTTLAQNLRDRVAEIGGKVLGSVLNKRRFYIPQPIYDRV